MSAERLPNRMIFFHSDKKCPKYDEFMELIKDDDLKNKLMEYSIDVSVNTDVANPGTFKIDFYNYDMNRIKSYSEGEIKDIFDDILNTMDKCNQKLTGGHKIDYKHKYEKYKKKYLLSKLHY